MVKIKMLYSVEKIGELFSNLFFETIVCFIGHNWQWKDKGGKSGTRI